MPPDTFQIFLTRQALSHRIFLSENHRFAVQQKMAPTRSSEGLELDRA